MIRFLLDTNVCIEILRGNKVVKQQFGEVGIEECAISEITVLELKMGEELAKLKGNSGGYIDQHLDVFLKGFLILPISNTFDMVAKEKARLRVAGTPAHNTLDLLIGCTAVVNGLTMVTDNTKDFKRITNIKLENWLEH